MLGDHKGVITLWSSSPTAGDSALRTHTVWVRIPPRLRTLSILDAWRGRDKPI